jgi:hypothetical protein
MAGAWNSAQFNQGWRQLYVLVLRSVNRRIWEILITRLLGNSVASIRSFLFNLFSKIMSNNSTCGFFPSNFSKENTFKTITYSFLASFSILGNSVLTFIILRTHSMLKKTYNILILNLALTNVLQGKFKVSLEWVCENVS